MSEPEHAIVIPDRRTFKPAEVCELLKLQPYVLRTWEQEFKELGVAKGGDGPRVYRRRDVELAARIRDLVFGEGLTLAGARRRLESERPDEPEPALEADDGDRSQEEPASGAGAGVRGLDAEARARVRDVRDELRTLLSELSSAIPRPGAVAAAAPAPRQPLPPREPDSQVEVREFTLEPLDAGPPITDDDERVVMIDAGKSKRRRRGGG